MEENKASGMNWKPILAVAVVVVVVLAAVGIYWLSKNNFNGITALEGYNISEGHSENGTLYHVQLPQVMFESGYAEGWTYSYHYYDESGELLNSRDIYVFSNGSVEIFNYSTPGLRLLPIKNWTVDSNEAFSIAISNTEIESFGGDCSFITLDTIDNRSVWHLSWVKSSVFDDPKSIDALIDASTGELIEVY